jgi:hypothetical protein
VHAKAGQIRMTDELGKGGGGSVRSLPAPGPGGPPEELRRVYIQHLGQLPDDLQAHLGHGPLDPAQVGPVHPGVVGERLLGELPLVADAPEVRRKKLA